MQRTGVGLIVAGLMSGFALRFIELPDDAALLYLLPMVALLLGATLLYRGKQLAAARSMRELPNDPRPPVVYLRPFASDESGWAQILSSLLTARIMTGFASDEEQLAQAIAPIGPLVAVGRPGESLPKPGATRAYSESNWKDLVDGWLARARLVILRPGTSSGVWWETQRAVEAVPPRRLLFLFVRSKRKDYRTFAEGLQSRCGIVLPAFEEISRWRRVFGFVRFDDDWRPRFDRFRLPYWRGGFKPLKRGYNHTLRPVFEDLGVPWRPTPVSALMVSVAGVMGLILTLLVAGGIGAVLSANARDEYESYDAYLDSIYRATSALDAGPVQVSAIPVSTPDVDRIPIWEAREVAGLVIAAPGHLEGVAQPQDSGATELLESTQFLALVGPTLRTQIAYFRYRPEIILTIDGAMRGYLDGIAGSSGVSAHHADTSTAWVDGHAAIRASQRFLEYGQARHAEVLVFAAGQSMWIVQVILDSAGDVDQAERILASVAIAGER